MEMLPRVLMVVENTSVPSDPRVWAEAEALRDKGFEVSIICPKDASYQQESYICLNQIHVYRYRLPTAATNKFTHYIKEYSISLMKTFWLSFAVLRRHGFDVIHAANPPDLFFTLGVFYRLLGKKFLFDQHDLAPELYQAKSNRHRRFLHKILLLLEWCSYRAAHIVLVTNPSQRKMAIERGGCPCDRVFIVWNGPDLERIKLVTPEPELKRGRPHLLAYVGRMSIQDGVEYALYALHELVYKRGRQDVSLVLMGNGDCLPQLQALAQKLNLDEYVHFTGWVSQRDILRYLTVADVGLSPDPQNGSNEYCTMIKVLEYMAMGKPIVAFDLAETRNTAQGAALYATPNLSEDFAHKIEILLDNEELRLDMGTSGRRQIEEELSWDHAKKHLLQAYARLLPRGSGSLAALNGLAGQPTRDSESLATLSGLVERSARGSGPLVALNGLAEQPTRGSESLVALSGLAEDQL